MTAYMASLFASHNLQICGQNLIVRCAHLNEIAW